MAKRSALSTDALVGRNIRIARMQRGLSQTALGQRLGVAYQQIQKYERGANRVGASRLVQIANALEVSLSTLFEGIPIAGEAAAPDDSLMGLLTDRHTLRLARALHRISDRETRSALVHLVEVIADARPRRHQRD